MTVQVKYLIDTLINEGQKDMLRQYITGPLCDLYGAHTFGGETIRRELFREGTMSYEFSYVIRRINSLPFFPKLDKLIEINNNNNCAEINCYFARKNWVKKFKTVLEKKLDTHVTMNEDVNWNTESRRKIDQYLTLI